MLARGLPGFQYVNNITDFPKALGNSATIAGVVRKRLGTSIMPREFPRHDGFRVHARLRYYMPTDLARQMARLALCAWPGLAAPACDPRCYRLPPHGPLPSREALVLWIGPWRACLEARAKLRMCEIAVQGQRRAGAARPSSRGCRPQHGLKYRLKLTRRAADDT